MSGIRVLSCVRYTKNPRDRDIQYASVSEYLCCDMLHGTCVVVQINEGVGEYEFNELCKLKHKCIDPLYISVHQSVKDFVCAVSF